MVAPLRAATQRQSSPWCSNTDLLLSASAQFCSSLPPGFPRIVFAPKALRPWKCPKHDQIVESPDTLHCTVAPWSLLLHLKHSRAEGRKFAYRSDHQTSQNQNKRWNRFYLLSSCKSFNVTKMAWVRQECCILASNAFYCHICIWFVPRLSVHPK